jgi:cob(I)alamin adenosyltransferase
MVTLNKIYTCTGDDGSTGLVGGARIDKQSLKVSAYGEVDEINSHLGLVRERLYEENKEFAERAKVARPLRAIIQDILITVQNELFDIGAELATPADSHWEGMLKVGLEHIGRLEGWIDQLNDDLPVLKSFILPGGSVLAAQVHVARTVCRRAERTICALHRSEPVSEFILKYINRLSDLLFVMGRVVVHQDGKEEFLWVPGGLRPKIA